MSYTILYISYITHHPCVRVYVCVCVYPPREKKIGLCKGKRRYGIVNSFIHVLAWHITAFKKEKKKKKKKKKKRLDGAFCTYILIYCIL
jgi:hypothetical protein